MPAQASQKSIQPLPDSWTDGQSERFYRVLERQEDVILIEVKNDSAIHLGYEVAIIQVLPTGIRNAPSASMREAYPRDHEFGRLGWSYGPRQLAAARERIARIFEARQLPDTEEHQIHQRADGTRVRVLPAVLKDNDDVYRQLKRSDDVAIFRADRLSTYEVVLIQVDPPHFLDQHKDEYDLVERYPSTEQLWGSAAWSWLSPLLAEAHFQFILKYGPLEDFHRSPEFRAALEAAQKAGQVGAERPATRAQSSRQTDARRGEAVTVPIWATGKNPALSWIDQPDAFKPGNWRSKSGLRVPYGLRNLENYQLGFMIATATQIPGGTPPRLTPAQQADLLELYPDLAQML